MKILKNGAFKEREYKETCRYCGCVFLFTADEAQERSQSRGGHVYYLSCPYCKHFLCVGKTMREQNERYDKGEMAAIPTLSHGDILHS